ncbi:MAG: hypothetical protein M1833_002526 [Piccolia ochrophora]|nr:MAG: hypothetical protein M1833_002526 [Piccolia ochrophora]
MAAPDDININDLTGDWQMNKTLSNDVDPVLQMQEISWLLRRAIGFATITLHVTHYTSSDPQPDTVHIDIAQTASMGIKGTTENRTLDWAERENTDHIFGKVRAKSRVVGLAGVDDDEGKDAFLKEGWLGAEAGEDGKEGGEGERGGVKVVEAWVRNLDKGWVARQVWGFAEVDGKRYHVRRVVVTKGEERLEVRLVYDFIKRKVGEVKEEEIG